MTQTELAEKMNISRSVLNRIEMGTRPIRETELLALAKFDGESYKLNEDDRQKLRNALEFVF